MSEEGYKPTEEEIKKAEDMMTDEQKIMSESRNEGFEIAQKEQEKNYTKNVAESPEQKLADFAKEMREAPRMLDVIDEKFDTFTRSEKLLLKTVKLSLMRGDAIDLHYTNPEMANEREEGFKLLIKKLWTLGIEVSIKRDSFEDSEGKKRVIMFVSAHVLDRNR